MKSTRSVVCGGALSAGLPAGAVPAQGAAPSLLSQNRPVTASSEGGSGYAAKNAVDGYDVYSGGTAIVTGTSTTISGLASDTSRLWRIPVSGTTTGTPAA
ncbi:hypothetical protein ACRYCC_34430 [Actinomadura scrupuli]|uniref:hypothetical protein n=1 Tax=Actinomadura scrupuli TaxID=559629 RepID=UPI003D953D60